MKTTTTDKKDLNRFESYGVQPFLNHLVYKKYTHQRTKKKKMSHG